MADMLRGARYHVLQYINVHSGPKGRSRVTHERADPLAEGGGGSEHLLFYVTDSSGKKKGYFLLRREAKKTHPTPEKTSRYFPNDLESYVYF